MNATTQQMQQHVERLAAENGITVGSHSSGGRAWRRSRIICIRPVKSACTYAIALHELGHILGPDQSKTRMLKEAGAWKWAIDNRLKLSASQRRTWDAVQQRCLQSYHRKAVRKHARGVVNAPTMPDPSHHFWTLAGVA
jgi:hypothetical protein